MPGVVSSLPDVIAAEVRAASDGARLDPGIQRLLNEALGEDFGSVRLYRGHRADQLCTFLGADAFASGSALFFRDGTYDPRSRAGLRLLIHEAWHVVQQRQRRVRGVPVGWALLID